jgi:ADP-ribose pyrophosphatase YjhB (NUDIX family)
VNSIGHELMMLKRIGFVWKLLPGWLRLRIIRATQQKFTVSAAAVIVNDRRQVLLLNHVLRPFSGWGLPGGFLSRGEQPSDGIRREIREETGIELDDLEMFRVRVLSTHVEILFTATSAGDPEVKSHEILELGWFDVASMPENMSPAQKELIKKLLNSGFDNQNAAV